MDLDYNDSLNYMSANATINTYADVISLTNVSAKKVFVGILLYSLTIWTIIGNIMVWIALFTNKQLKQGGMSNYLIGNLALSDLLLGITVLPFSASVSTLNYWVFGKYLCDVWLSFDVLCSTASIWGLLVIAIDRYIATNHPIIYRKQKNSIKTATVYCTIAWTIAFAISIPPFMLDLFATGNRKTDDNESKNLIRIPNSDLYECVLFQKPSFVILSSLCSFYVPALIMLLLYAKVFLKIRQQTKSMKKNNYSMIDRKQSRTKSRSTAKGSSKSSRTNKDNNTNGVQQQRISRSETRITKTLAIIICCFIMCFLPFFTTYIVRSQIDREIPIMDAFMWLGYFNSALNPILYAIFNNNFRTAFKDIMALKCFTK